MMNIQDLGLQESVGVKYINGICAKFYLKHFKMALDLIQKQSSKQESLHKVGSEEAVRKCFSK